MVVDERTHLPEVLADEDRIAHLQGAARDKQRGRRTESLLELGLDHISVRAALGVGRKFKHVGLQKDHLQQVVHTLPGSAGYFAAHHVAAPFLGREPFLLEHLLDALHVGRGLVALCDRHHDLHPGLAGELDRLLRLRHDAVVGRDDDHRDVRELRSALTHGVERRMAGRVEKCYQPAVHIHLVRGYLLRDATGLARRHLRVADIVHQRRLAVVDMAEERHHRRTRLHVLGLVLGYLVIRVDRL